MRDIGVNSGPISSATEVARAVRSSNPEKSRMTGEGIPDAAAVEFGLAMEEFKHRTGHKFPTWSEALEVLRSLGYRKETQ